MKFCEYIEAPNYTGDVGALVPLLFMAGGITGVRDWQAEVKERLLGQDSGGGGGTLLNPRRAAFDVKDPDGAKVQIEWEYQFLKASDVILFWFEEGAIQPIALFELGRWSYTNVPLFVGVHPNYERRLDVEVQMSLVRPKMPMYYSVAALCEAIKEQEDLYG